MAIALQDTPLNDARGAVTLTPGAARRVTAILEGEPTGAVFRVAVEGGGCSGFQYRFAVEPGASAEDALIEREGARVVVDPASLDLIAGAQIDFVDDLLGQSFRVVNPNATASCGCGVSFSI